MVLRGLTWPIAAVQYTSQQPCLCLPYRCKIFTIFWKWHDIGKTIISSNDILSTGINQSRSSIHEKYWLTWDSAISGGAETKGSLRVVAGPGGRNCITSTSGSIWKLSWLVVWDEVDTDTVIRVFQKKHFFEQTNWRNQSIFSLEISFKESKRVINFDKV